MPLYRGKVKKEQSNTKRRLDLVQVVLNTAVKFEISDKQNYCEEQNGKPNKAAKISSRYRHHTGQQGIISWVWTPLITCFHLKENNSFHESY